MKIINTYVYFKVITLLVSPTVTNSSIPRSTRNYNYHEYNTITYNPPWNPSSKIDNEGFIKEYYRCIPGEWEDCDQHEDILFINKKYKIPSIVQIRQVPGDGNCLFHSIATCLSVVENKTHVNVLDNNYLSNLCTISKRLRNEAVNCLSKRPKRPLFIQGNEYLRAYDLVQAAASQYNLTGSKYCELMRKESYWGGGPEIVALCNALRRPIYVYELVSSATALRGGSTTAIQHDDTGICINKGFCLRRMACFGSPKFNKKEAIHILSADSRFPDVTPGRQLQNGNHFLALFPTKLQHYNNLKGGDINKKYRKKNIQGENDANSNVLVLWFSKIRRLIIQISFSGGTK